MAVSTRVFISATSGDLGSIRQTVKDALLSMECFPVEQTNFPPDYRTVRDMLKERIAGCQAVIHIVGKRYGAEPDPAKLPAEASRRSYTQMEFDLARQLNKRVYIFLCPDDFPYDACEPESDEHQQLQQSHRDTLTADERLRTEVDSREGLATKVQELKIELHELRGQMRRSTISVLAGVAVLIVLLAGVVYGIAQLGGDVDAVGEGLAGIGQGVEQLGSIVETKSDEALAEIRKLYEDPDVLTGKLKSHIRERADEEIALAKTDKAEWRKIDEIEKRRDSALSRVEDLVTTIRDGLAGKPDPIFAEAARILAEDGVDEAIAFLEAKQPAIESRVNESMTRRDQAVADVQEAETEFHESLEPWLLQAELHESNLAFDKALERYELVASKAPEWSRAHQWLGWLLTQIAEFEKAEPHLKAAFELADNDHQRAFCANVLGLFYLQMGRWSEAEPLLEQSLRVSEELPDGDATDTAAALTNLGQLLQQKSRLQAAELLYRRALAIETRSSESKQLFVAVHLNNLAHVLHATHRSAEAEPLYRRALAISEQSLKTEWSKVATILNNLADVLRDTNRLAEAESLYRRALAINEQAFGTEHPKVAMDLNDLALFLRHTKRVSEAEPLYRRPALAIDEHAFGSEHHNVATNLGNLANLLRATNRLSEAEPLYRRAVAINEQSYGSEHPSIAINLTDLARLLKSTNRLIEAEPLYRRALVIDEHAYGTEHTNVAMALNNLGNLLRATNRASDGEPLIRRALAISEQFYGAEHPSIAIQLNNLVLCQPKSLRAKVGPILRRAVVIVALAGKAMGREHPNFLPISHGYGFYLKAIGLSEDEIAQQLKSVHEVTGPLEPIVPEVERILGPAPPVAEFLASLDLRYKDEGKPEIYFLAADQPIAAHLDQLLGPCKLNVSLDEPIAPHIDELLGPATSTNEVFAALDAQYAEQGKSPLHLVALDEPVSPHLDERLGPATTVEQVLAALDEQYRQEGRSKVWFLSLDEPISPYVDELLGKVEGP